MLSSTAVASQMHSPVPVPIPRRCSCAYGTQHSQMPIPHHTWLARPYEALPLAHGGLLLACRSTAGALFRRRTLVRRTPCPPW